MKKKQERILVIVTALLILVSAAVLFLTHRNVPFMMDDLWYFTVLWEDTPISSFGDIVRSQIWHYNNWGGRSMTHGMLQLTLLLGELGADILNVLVTFLLAGMTAVVAGGNRLHAESGMVYSGAQRGRHLQEGFFLVFAALAMLIGLNANWKMSMFWQAGAANYLYITVFILGFLYCYLRELPENGEAREVVKLPGITFWIVPLGILAGWSNENMGPAVWLGSIAVMLLLRKKKRNIKPWMVLGSISCLTGSIAMIAAPGNFVRSAQAAGSNYGFLWQLFLRCYEESKSILEYLFPTLLVLAGVFFVSKCVLKLPLGRKNGILLFCALLSWGAMVLSPHYPDRASFGTMTLLICVILNLGKKVVKQRRDLLLPLFVLTAFIWLRGMYFLGEFLAISWGWIR